MLTKEESAPIFTMFAILSKFAILPIKVDFQSGKISNKIQKWRKLLSLIYFIMASMVVIYQNIRLIQSFLIKEYFVIFDFPIHATVSFAGILGLLYFAFQFLIWPDVTVTIFNSLFEPTLNKVKKKRGLLEYSILEIMTLYIPCAVFVTAMTIMLIAVFNPKMKMLLHSFLGHETNVQTFMILLAFECIVFYFTLSSFVFGVVVQMLIFLKIDNALKNIDTFMKKSSIKACWKRAMPAPASSLRLKPDAKYYLETISLCRETVLSITFFNQSNCFLIFAFKIQVISISVLNLAYSVNYFTENPIVGMLSSSMAFNAMTVYTVLYDQPFRILEQLKSIKKELVRRVREDLQGKERLLIVKSIWSIRNVGVKVGSFHLLERKSTPNFIHFILRNAGRLLVTFGSFA